MFLTRRNSGDGAGAETETRPLGLVSRAYDFCSVLGLRGEFYQHLSVDQDYCSSARVPVGKLTRICGEMARRDNHGKLSTVMNESRAHHLLDIRGTDWRTGLETLALDRD